MSVAHRSTKLKEIATKHTHNLMNETIVKHDACCFHPRASCAGCGVKTPDNWCPQCARDCCLDCLRKNWAKDAKVVMMTIYHHGSRSLHQLDFTWWPLHHMDFKKWKTWWKNTIWKRQPQRSWHNCQAQRMHLDKPYARYRCHAHLHLGQTLTRRKMKMKKSGIDYSVGHVFASKSVHIVLPCCIF